MKRFLRITTILLLILLGACHDGSDSPAPVTPPAVTAPEIISSPDQLAYLGKEYRYEPEISGTAPTLTVNSLPAWLHFDADKHSLSGTPTAADMATCLNPLYLTITASNAAGTRSQDWSLYILEDRLRERTYTGTSPDYTPEAILALPAEEFHEAMNRAALLLHGHGAAASRSLVGKQVKIALVDTGVDPAGACDGAVVYRALPCAPSEPDSHGNNMARYMLNYSPAAELYDMAMSYPYDLIFTEALARDVDIVSLSASAQNTVGFVRKEADAMAALVRAGKIVSHSIGNLADLAHDDTPEKVWYWSKAGEVVIADQTLESYKFGNPFNFLPQIKGYEDLDDAPGALVQVQAVIAENTVDKLVTLTPNRLALDHIRSNLGFAKDDGITVIENGSGATSQATASFSGIMALLCERARELDAGLSGRQLTDIVFATATDIGAPGVDEIYGHGLVNLTAALELLERVAAGTAEVPVIERSAVRLDPAAFAELPRLREELREASGD